MKFSTANASAKAVRQHRVVCPQRQTKKEEQQGPSPRRIGISRKAAKTIFGSQKQKESRSLEQMTPANQFLQPSFFGKMGMQIREKRETLIKRLVTAQTERFRRFEGCKQRPVSKRIGSSCHLQTPSAESSVKGRPVTGRKDSSDPKSDKPVADSDLSGKAKGGRNSRQKVD
jgi:hypothetical protein